MLLRCCCLLWIQWQICNVKGQMVYCIKLYNTLLHSFTIHKQSTATKKRKVVAFLLFVKYKKHKIVFLRCQWRQNILMKFRETFFVVVIVVFKFWGMFPFQPNTHIHILVQQCLWPFAIFLPNNLIIPYLQLHTTLSLSPYTQFNSNTALN